MRTLARVLSAQRGSTSRLPLGGALRVMTTIVVAVLLLSFIPTIVSAQAHEVGYYPDSNETCKNITDGFELAGYGMAAGGAVGSVLLTPVGGAAVSLLGVSVGLVGHLAGGLCEDLDEAIQAKFIKAYDEAISNGIRPGDASNDVHYWVGGIMIQDFVGVEDSSGNQIGDGWGAIILDGVDGSEPHFVFGSTWKAYKRAIEEKSVLGGGIFPGYPTSFEHQWNRVTIQDFSGGSWGISAIIGGDQETAWLVAGNHLQAYMDEDGSNALGNPLGPVERNEDGDYQQRFEDGIIFELAGDTWVEYYDESDTPEEFPPVGYEEPADSVIEPSDPEDISSGEQAPTDTDVACSESGGIQITSPLTVTPENPDTDTTVMFSVTLTNFGCETWAPKILAIAGRTPLDGDEHILDPYQNDNFQLGPGESREITQSFTLHIPGEWHFYMAYYWTNDNWNEIYDASGDSPRVFVDVTDAGLEQVDPPEDDYSGDSEESIDLSEFEAGCHYSWEPEGYWDEWNCDRGDTADSPEMGPALEEPPMDGCVYFYDGSYFYRNHNSGTSTCPIAKIDPDIASGSIFASTHLPIRAIMKSEVAQTPSLPIHWELDFIELWPGI